jgi:hypothetical protein
VRPLATASLSIVVALAAAACGGGTHPDSRTGPVTDTTGGIETPTLPEFTTKGCSFVKAEDVTRIAPGREADRLDLAPGPEVACSTVFRGAGGSITAAVTELPGGTKALQTLRAAKAAELGDATVRPLPTLGQGAFIARNRYLAFARGSRVVIVETGYGSANDLILSVRQLTELAQLVAGRL